MKNQTPMPTSKDQPRKPTIAELEQGLEAYHTKLRIFLQHEGFGALREHWIDTYFAMKYAEELAKARDEEFARRVHVPHLPPAEHCRCLEVCLRRNSGLRIAYRPAVFLGDWWNRSSGLDQEWFFSRNAWLKFGDVVAFEQGNATTEMKDRPTVRYDLHIRPLSKASTAKDAARAGQPAGTPP